jgi:hypothetical protein
VQACAERATAAAEQERMAQVAAWALREALAETLRVALHAAPASTPQEAPRVPDTPGGLGDPLEDPGPACPADGLSDEKPDALPGSGSGLAVRAAAWVASALACGAARPEAAPRAWHACGALLLQLHAAAPSLQHGPAQALLALGAALALRPALCALVGLRATGGGNAGTLAGLRAGPEVGCDGPAEQAAGATAERGQDGGGCGGGEARQAWVFLVGNTLLRLLDRLRPHPGQGPAADPARGAAEGAAAAPGARAGATLPHPGGPLQAHVPSAEDPRSGAACEEADQDAVAAAVILLLQECAAGQPPRATAAVLAAWAAGEAGPALQRAAEVEALHARAAGVRLGGVL